MQIDILYFDGCPNHRHTTELVRDIVRALDLERHLAMGIGSVRGVLGQTAVDHHGLAARARERELDRERLVDGRRSARYAQRQGERASIPRCVRMTLLVELDPDREHA